MKNAGVNTSSRRRSNYAARLATLAATLLAHVALAGEPYRALPHYDSGWTALTAGGAAVYLYHNLGGDSDDYVVDMQYRSGGSGVNQRYYGGNDFGTNVSGSMSENDRVGAYWRSLTSSSVAVYRRPDDIYASQVRVRIWRAPRPDYDSGWVAVGAGDTATSLAHALGKDSDDYVVDMQYQSPGSGVNQRYYGGNDFGANVSAPMNENDRVGAYWRSLGTHFVTIYRRPDDIYAPYIRIRIFNTRKASIGPLVPLLLQ